MKVYRKLLASYLCVCLIPLVLSMYTMVKLERGIQKSIIEDRERMAYAARHDMDQRLTDAMNAIGILAEEPIIASLGQKQSLSIVDVHELCQLVGVFSATVSQQSSYSRGFCYFTRSGYMVSSQRTYHPWMMDLFTWELGVEPEEFVAALEEDGPASRVTVIRGGGQEHLLVLRQVYDSQYRAVVGYVGMMMKLDEGLLQREGESTEAFLINGGDELLFGGELAQAAGESLLSAQTGDVVAINGSRYLYAVYPSQIWGLQYGFLTDQSSYYAGVLNIWQQLLIEVLIYFVVGIGAAMLLGRRTWSPFNRVLLFLKKSRGEDDPAYESIEGFANALRGVAEERETLENQLSRQREQQRGGYIGRYLQGITDDDSALSQFIEDGQPYRLLVFSMIHPEQTEFFRNIPKERLPETMETLQFAARNVLDEVLLAERGGVSLADGGCMVLLLQDTVSGKAFSPADAEAAVGLVESTLGVPVSCTVSDVCIHLADAPDAWDWVQRARRSDAFWQQNAKSGVRLASEILQTQEYCPYEDFLDRQKKLSGYLASGSNGKARKCLEEMVKLDLSGRELPFEMVQHRYIGMAEVVLPYLPEGERDGVVKDILRQRTISQLQDSLWALFDRAQCGLDAETADNKNGPWAQSVQAYIRENYQNPALNASMIADYLGMNLSTLSRRYKNTCGHGVLDELHLVRLEAAKRLLEQGASVKEAAEQTGYVESRTMIRAFKRYEGIPPGQYSAHLPEGE